MAHHSRSRLIKLLGSLLSISAVFLGYSAQSFAWTKTYAIDWIEPANFYDPHDKEQISAEAPGNDCPNGVTQDPDYPKLLIQVGHEHDSVQHLYDPEVRNAPGFDRSVFANRGRNGENVYKEPWHAIEQDYPLVEGKIAYGMDLDNDPSTGFTGVDGTPGVDNAWYKVTGCVGYFRGRQRDSGGFKYSNEAMHNGRFTILMVLEGTQDPRNDPAATLSFKTSKDPLVRDAMGGIAKDYSFRIDDKPEFESTVPVTITNGIVEIAEQQTFVLKDWKHRIPLTLQQGKLRFEMTEDDKLVGMVAGYRDWKLQWQYWSNYIPEIVVKLDMPSYWYNLRRYADGIPDPATGEMTAVSSVYNIWAVPAFSVDGINLTSVNTVGAR